MQSDYFGSAVGADNATVGSVRGRQGSDYSGPARKFQKRESSDSSSSNHDDQDDTSIDNTSANNPNGPPFICPTCSTSYSRLEYLRRHERRHADIRPFVCDCGKGFSRSDVLSRHKRQCRVVLQSDANGEGVAQAGEAPAKSAKPRRASSTAKPGRPKGSTKAAKAAAARTNGHSIDGQTGATGSDLNISDGPVPPPPAPGADHTTHETVAAIAAAAAAAAAAASGHHQRQTQDQDVSNMIDPAIAADSQAQAAAAATTAAAINSVAAYQYANPMDPPDFHMGRGAGNPYASASFPHAPVHSAIAALHPQLYQPSSPESNASRSEHGSPRYASQGLSRHTSNSGSSRFMRPSAYEQYGARPLGSASAFSSAADAAVWEGLDTAKLPSPGHVTTPGSAARATAAMLASLGFPVTSPLSHLGDRSRDASYFRSTAPGLGGGNANSPAFSFGTTTSSSGETGTGSNQSGSNATAPSSATQGHEASGATTPKEPVRFSVSTLGPLSPFSVTALNSSSPYMSAFSAARDTPLVSSPRSSVPITPGGLTSFDLGGQWNGMRPPSRTVSRHNSIHGLNTASTSQATSPQSADSVSGKPAKSASSDRTSLMTDRGDQSDTLDKAVPETSFAPTSAAVNTPASTAASTVNVPARSAATSSETVGSIPAHATEPTVSSSIDTPSRFAKSGSEQYFDGGALTPGPEAFLLRLQGGAQEMRAGIHGQELSLLNGPYSGLGSVPSGSPQVATPSWDPAMFLNMSGPLGTDATAPGPQGNTFSWLMSPNIQQLLNVFSATSGTGVVDANDKSDYFNSKAIEAAPSSVDVKESVTTSLDKAFSDAQNPFYIPPTMFRACYSILHWNLPPITRLSMLALHAQQNLLKHFPIIHEPTFRLDSTPACITFGICMLGGHEAGRKWWAGEEVVPKSAVHILNSVSQPDRSNVMQQIMDQGPSRYVDEEDGQELVKPLVMSEKMDMLMRTFAAHCKSAKDKYSVVQTMLLFQGNNFLSSDAATRTIAGISHGTVVALARQAGFFDPHARHVSRQTSYTSQEADRQILSETTDSRFSIMRPSHEPSLADDDRVWRRWVELEGRRRTAYLLYTMDTIANLDAGVPTLLATEEVCHVSLPTPDYIWRAPTSDSWRKMFETCDGPTLDEALQQLTRPENPSPLSDARKSTRSIYGSHGPFARLIMMVALLRGIVDLLEGRVTRVSKPSSLGRWLRRVTISNGRSSGDMQISTFKKALSRWRKAWDQDVTCHPSPPRPEVKLKNDTLLSDSLFTPLTASGAVSLADDALPLYWLSHVLVTHADSDSKLPQRSSGAIMMQDMNGVSAEVPGSAPNMPDYRAMLRFAKNFVIRGEK